MLSVETVEHELDTRSKWSKYYSPKDGGLEHIELIRAQRDRYYVPKDRIVGSFGIVDSNGYELMLDWRVSGYRKDGLHGAVNPSPASPYCSSLFDSMFAGWK